MTSIKQITANRQNARKSTGPVSEQGKLRSRCNAVRHGLTAETVISALEDAQDYKDFEAAIIADYDAQSAVERELVLRLASLLWRLRRATAIETGLFDIQASHVRSFRQHREPHHSSDIVDYAFNPADTEHTRQFGLAPNNSDASSSEQTMETEPVNELAHCFLRLSNLPSYALDRLSRYEATIWRQAGQIMFALDALKRRKPWEGRRRLGGRGFFDETGYVPQKD